MPTSSEQRPNRPTTAWRSRLLRCRYCGRTEARSPEELLPYADHGWPECCGQVMAYFALLSPDDAAPTHPAAA